jgi:hypothetical protein
MLLGNVYGAACGFIMMAAISPDPLWCPFRSPVMRLFPRLPGELPSARQWVRTQLRDDFLRRE